MRSRFFRKVLCNQPVAGRGSSIGGGSLTCAVVASLMIGRVIDAIKEREAGHMSKSEEKFEINSHAWWNMIAGKYNARRDLRDDPKEFPKLAELCQENDGPVLEVGCAFGVFSRYLHPGVHYLGMDISERLIERARELHPDRLFLTADIMSSEFGNEANKPFTTVACFQTLEHFVDPKLVVAKLRRVSRSRLVFSVPYGIPSRASAEADGHVAGWSSPEALVADWKEFGTVTTFVVRKVHICGFIDWF